VFARYGRTCHVCGGYAADIDHLIPIGADGDDSLANLRPSCARCNRGWR
jgi:5-methylcytosine-specific restriction endonuclease McrA